MYRLMSLWERGLPAIQTPRSDRHTASSFIAGKPRSHTFFLRAKKNGAPTKRTVKP